MSVLYPELEFDLVYFEPGERFAGEARFVDGEGQHDRYEGDDPEYQRIASEFGWNDEDEEDDDEEEDEERAAGTSPSASGSVAARPTGGGSCGGR
jgi:hypothetical protein